MFSVKRKVGIKSVIEAGIRPRFRVMAGIALLTTASFVHIVFSVAAVAGCWRVLVCLVGMAGQAFNLAVISNKREISCVVIEGRVGPVPGIVAVGTLAAQVAIVCIVFQMTVYTYTRRIPALDVRQVTAGAFRLSVMTQQFEVSEEMIESCFVQPQDIGVSSFVVGMAGRAGAAIDIR